MVTDSQKHQRDFQDFDKNRNTVDIAERCKYRDVNGDDARRYLETGQGGDKYKYLMLCSHQGSWDPPALVMAS